MAPDLTTTNVLLGIMAAVSLLQVLAVIGVFVAGAVIYRHVLHLVDGIEQRLVAPAVGRINAILDEVKGVTSTVKEEAGRIDRLIDWLLGAVSHKPSFARGDFRSDVSRPGRRGPAGGDGLSISRT
jgi:hypothetical protein